MRLLVAALAGLTLSACASSGAQDYAGVEVHRGSTARTLGADGIDDRAAAIAVVSTDVGRGMGFVIDPQGFLLTNRHVLEDGDHVEEVVLPHADPPKRFASATIVYIDPIRDLALLKVDTKHPLPYLRLATDASAPVTRYLARADEVTLWARRDRSSRGVDFFHLTPRVGTVDSLTVQNPEAGPGAFVGLDVRVERGQSGGPIVDRYGRAVGVLTWAWRNRSGGYAIPIAEAMTMLAERPNLADDHSRQDRAGARVRGFLAAMRGRRLDDAKRMMSPSFARKIRSKTLADITAAGTGDGTSGLQEFLGALEAVATGQTEGRTDHPMELLRDLVERTTSREFRAALGLDASMDSAQIMAFFYEFGTAYLVARQLGGQGPGDALQAAVQRLQTIDAARTFALAELSRQLAEGPFQVDRVEILPGMYAPRAVVTLRAAEFEQLERDGTTLARAKVQDDPRGGRRVTVHLRLEWGDWYVADVT